MPISIDVLRNASYRTSRSPARTLNEAKSIRVPTAFLCHSHKDADLARGLVNLMRENGWNLYVDWADETMPATPNRETASKIKTKIIETNYFLFLATVNSMASRWCPWEIGYADGTKDIDRIMIIPTVDSSGIWHGSEYLQLYRKIDKSSTGDLAAWHPNQQNGIWIRSL